MPTAEAESVEAKRVVGARRDSDTMRILDMLLLIIAMALTEAK
jgi:hypothetical protein